MEQNQDQKQFFIDLGKTAEEAVKACRDSRKTITISRSEACKLLHGR